MQNISRIDQSFQQGDDLGTLSMEFHKEVPQGRYYRRKAAVILIWNGEPLQVHE